MAGVMITLWLGCVFSCGQIVCAQQPGAIPQVGTPERLDDSPAADKDEDEIRIKSADRARYDSKRGLFYLFGNVQFADDEMTLNCDEASYNENDDTAACAGNLKIVDDENVITGKMMNADFNAEKVRIEGAVTIVSTKQPEPPTEPGAEPEEPKITTVTCDKILYTYTEGKRQALASGNLKAVQDDKTVTAAQADYDIEKDIVVLKPRVIIKMDNGNEFECTRATISTVDDWVDMEGFTGVATRKKKEQPPATEPSAPSPSPPPES